MSKSSSETAPRDGQRRTIDGAGRDKMTSQLKMATKYIYRIRNNNKRGYAIAWHDWFVSGINAGVEPERPDELSNMAAQAVQMNIREIYKPTPEQVDAIEKSRRAAYNANDLRPPATSDVPLYQYVRSVSCEVGLHDYCNGCVCDHHATEEAR